MKTALRFLVTLCLGLLTVTPGLRATAAETSDSLRVYLLTCEPGEAIYELYGHTAISVENLREGTGTVYNYGVFNFDKPHFIWRFMLGQTDYTVGVEPYDLFTYSYARDGRSIDAQLLNLTQAEAARLLRALKENAETPDWTYRYNFLYDNCTTRAVDLIVRSLDGKVVWPAADTTLTFRSIIHQFADVNAWDRLGQDLVLGAEVDAPIGLRQQLFSPIYAADFFDGAMVVDKDGQQRRLVIARWPVVQAMAFPSQRYLIGPLAVFVLLVALTLYVCSWELRHRRVCRLYDDALLLLQGLAGCLIAFLFFLSEHPAVGSNWIIFLLNPLPLLFLPVKVWRDHKGLRDVYPIAEGVLVLLFLVSTLVTSQKFPVEIYLVALVLLLRCVSVLLVERSRKRCSALQNRRVRAERPTR